jgi:serine/threonine-protein kinase
LPRCVEHDRALVDVRFLGAEPDATLGQTLAARYVVLERIAVGATSSVFRARDLVRGLDVALKIVPPHSPLFGEARLRFAQETRTLAQLESPHVVRVFEFGELEDGSCFLAMELLKGETLGARLRRGPLTPRDALRITEGALRALVEAHAKGIVHRDLKPENLFLSSNLPGHSEFCKVVDFGIATLGVSGEGGSSEAEPWGGDCGTVLGTPRYMSPEQAQGAPVDGRSDLYSLGVILFQMLTGAPPFVAPDPVLVMAKHVRELPPSLTVVAPHLSSAPRLVALVRRVLSKSPEDRPQTAGDFLRSLEGVRRDLGLVTMTTTATGALALPAAVRRRRSGFRWYLLLSAAACLGFIGLGWLARTHSSHERREAAGVPVQAEPPAYGSAPLRSTAPESVSSSSSELRVPSFTQQILDDAAQAPLASAGERAVAPPSKSAIVPEATGIRHPESTPHVVSERPVVRTSAAATTAKSLGSKSPVVEKPVAGQASDEATFSGLGNRR